MELIRVSVIDWLCVICLSCFSRVVCDKCAPDRDPDTRKLWWYQVPAAHQGRRNEISPEGKRKFENKRITCGTSHPQLGSLIVMTDQTLVEYRALSPTSEREVFQRVQLGMSLSAAGASPQRSLVETRHR